MRVVFVLFTVWSISINGDEKRDFRLPNWIIPQHYNLEIVANLANNYSIDGRVWIKVRCLHSTKSIVLHSKDLIIDEKSVRLLELPNNTTIKIDGFNFDKENDFLIIDTVEELTKSHDYLLFVPFVGELKEDVDGFYRSSYTNHNKKKWFAVTHFEAANARKAFPCFDEPAMKATFKIHLGRRESYTSISNMPIASTELMENKPGWCWDHYEESPPMSTYLIAFVIIPSSDFKYMSAPLNDGTLFKIWARSEALQQITLAKIAAQTCLEYYAEFFNVAYPLPKQDIMVLPDFAAGGMENWGLVLYDENRVFYDAVDLPITAKTSVAKIVMHELAHQWFGDLVTMKWWSDLWMKEGFATYMANLAVENAFPQWNFFRHETVNILFTVFSEDSLKASHPMSVPVNDPDGIAEAFDTISYDKGSLVPYMLANFLGTETFRKGCGRYLKNNKYKNTDQDTMWEAFTDQAHNDNALPKNLTVQTIMHTWTLQTGYPVVTVTRDYHKNSARLTQKRFLRGAIKTSRSEADCWWIPVTYTTKRKLNFNATCPSLWLSCPSEKDSIVHDLASSDEWVIFNLQISGLYRVNYDEKNWNLITSSLNSHLHHKIPPMNKVQLIDDSANLAWIGDASYLVYLDVLQYLKHEEEYLPWFAALTSINTLNNMVKKSQINGLFRIYVKKLLMPIYSRIGGFKLPANIDENLEDIKQQVQITSWSCKFDVGNCINEARRLFDKWQTNQEKNVIPIDHRPTVYCTAINHGGEKEWNFLWKQYQASNSTTEKSSILQALGCTCNVSLLQQYLEWAITNNSGIPLQDAVSVLQAVAVTDVGYPVAKNFLQTRMKDIYEYLLALSWTLYEVIATLASQMTTNQEYEEFKRFAEVNEKYLLENKQTIKKALEIVEFNVQWHTKRFKEFKELLPKYLNK